MQNPFKLTLPSYRRKPVSSEFKDVWTLVFIGVTNRVELSQEGHR
jgi:hypothetical protein